jgi:hypothetical protein
MLSHSAGSASTRVRPRARAGPAPRRSLCAFPDRARDGADPRGATAPTLACGGRPGLRRAIRFLQIGFEPGSRQWRLSSYWAVLEKRARARPPPCGDPVPIPRGGGRLQGTTPPHSDGLKHCHPNEARGPPSRLPRDCPALPVAFDERRISRPYLAGRYGPRSSGSDANDAWSRGRIDRGRRCSGLPRRLMYGVRALTRMMLDALVLLMFLIGLAFSWPRGHSTGSSSRSASRSSCSSWPPGAWAPCDGPSPVRWCRGSGPLDAHRDV